MKAEIPVNHMIGTTLFLIAVYIGWRLGMALFSQ
jgi:hypothetical protein